MDLTPSWQREVQTTKSRTPSRGNNFCVATILNNEERNDCFDMINMNLDILNNGIVLGIWRMMVGLIVKMLMQLPRKKESSKANHTSSLELGKRYIDANWTWTWTWMFYLVKVVLQPSFPIENNLVMDNLCFVYNWGFSWLFTLYYLNIKFASVFLLIALWLINQEHTQ